MARIVVVGEGMLELRRAAISSDGWQLGFGGDTLNTAIHLSRMNHDVRYFTALGDDAFSDELRRQWQAEGIDVSLVATVPDALPGLYAIRTDAHGERTFTYWRGESAARRNFSAPHATAAIAAAADADMLVFSLISLAILPDDGRQTLIDLAIAMRRAGKEVAFDGNYRPRLWRNVADAQFWRDRAIATCTIGLPTLEDEVAMGADSSAAAIAARWMAGGAHEVVVKLGADGCLLPDGAILPPPARLNPVDTSGAGDAFNAGYLDARAKGTPARAAALAGHVLAGWVVMRVGAVPARDGCDPAYAG